MVHKIDVCHPGGSQDEFLPREAVFKPVNCCLVKLKSRWLSLTFPAGMSLPAAWDQWLLRWKGGDVVGWEEPSRLGRDVLECGRSRWMEGGMRTRLEQGVVPHLKSHFASDSPDLNCRVYSILKLKLPLSFACFVLFFGSG